VNMAPKKNTLVPPELSPLSIARMLWKRKVTTLVLCAIGLMVTAVVVYRLPAVYKAEALILVDSQKIPEKYVSSTVNTDVGDRLATINQQIMSTSRLLKIIQNFDLYHQERQTSVQEEIIERMRADIKVETIKGWTGGRPGAFRVSYEGKIPSIVAEVTNQLANLYIEENLKTRETQAEGTAEFIDSQLEQAKKSLDEQEAKVSQFKQQYNGTLPQQENSLLSSMSSLRVQLQGNQDAINRAQQNKLMLETALATAEASAEALVRLYQPRPTAATASPASEPRPSGSGLSRKPSEALEAQLELLRGRYTDDHPEIRRVRLEIDRLKQLEQQEAQKGAARNAAAASEPKPTKDKPTVAPTPDNAPAPLPTRELLQERERVANLKAQLTNVKRDMELQTADRERISKALASYQSRVDTLPLVEQKMAALTRDYENSKANYKSLLDKKMSAGMATDMERRQKSERFTIIDPARAPAKPFKPNRPLLAGMGAVLSLALGLLAGFGLEFKKQALLGEWELPGDVTVLGRVPRIDMSIDGSAGNLKLLRLALVSVAVLSIPVAAAGVYFLWRRI
jgi:polysaccharide biosynthesis transport protein